MDAESVGGLVFFALPPIFPRISPFVITQKNHLYKRMLGMPKPLVLSNPEASQHLKRGFDKMAQVLTLTMGPSQGQIMVDALVGSKVELLTDAATIARRIIELPGRGENAGAMLLRHAVWQVHERIGDGTATTAVLAQSILDEVHRAKAAGFNPMLLRRGLEKASQAAIESLKAMAQPLHDEDDISLVAEHITGEAKLSLILGEVYDLLGADAHVKIENYVAPYMEREFIEGGSWKGQLASRHFISDAPTRRAILSNCYVALFDGPLETAEQVIPLLELMAEQEQKNLALIATRIEDAALSVLVPNHLEGKVKILAAKLEAYGDNKRFSFADMAVLTGAKVLDPQAGHKLENITLTDLGKAQRVEGAAKAIFLVGSQRNSPATRDVISQVRHQIDTFAEARREEKLEDIQQRLGRLTGRIAILKIGASTKAEQANLKEKTEKAIVALPLALREGVVPGGGVAYMHCIPAIKALNLTEAEAFGADILAKALTAPCRQLLLNAGVDSPAVIIQDLQSAGPPLAYDVLNLKYVNLNEAGLLDPVGVLWRVLDVAVSCALMAFTTETLIGPRKPRETKKYTP